MIFQRLFHGALLFLLTLVATSSNAREIDRIDCSACDGWNADVEPFLIAPNSWYVGTRGLSSILIDSGDGLVLLDGGLPQSAHRIATHVRQLGFRLEDIRYIAVSHEHFDHAGGVAQLASWSGAVVLSSADGARALEQGRVDPRDPQQGFDPRNRFPAVARTRAVRDGDRLALGRLEMTAAATPGHAPGGMSWHWNACDARGDCQSLLYADSLNAVSAPGYRYLDHRELLGSLRASIDTIREARCDVLIAPHPEQAALFERAAAGRLRDSGRCRRYADAAEHRLALRLEEERGR